MDPLLFLAFLAACGASAATGLMFRPGAWYDTLDKPGWTPPNWVFPAAWSILYLLMAAAATRVAPLPGSAFAMAFWAVQIAFNTLWTPVFFGLRGMRAALSVIGVLWLAVAATMLAFWRLDALAGMLFVPYLAWVTLAAALNAAVLRRNQAPA